MNFISTRGGDKVTGAQAILQGIAVDGGLFVPEKLPKVTKEEFSAMAEMSYPERVAFILGKFFGEELGQEFLKEVCEKAYASFTSSDPAPLIKIDDGFYILELYHGPTCSYKDMSMVLFPALLKKSKELLGVKEDILLLTATSGDAGKSALENFKDEPNVKVAVFYPDEGVAKMQRLQMSIQDGDNLFVAAVSGSFDECQKTVKKLLVDESFKEELLKKNTRVSTPNSINFVRIAAQITYYFSAYLDMLSAGRIEEDEKIDFVVPTGNFGNVMAGWYAKHMGLPIRKLLCSSNRNKVLADFFTTGKYDTKRNFYRTMSPSMDLQIASNLERLLFEVSGRNAGQTADRMKNLLEKGEYSITMSEKAKLDEDFYSGFASEDDTVEAMYDLFEEYGYPMDTHTGVALAVYAEYADKKDKKDFTSTVVLSTGNPYKFPQDVLYALSGNDVKDSFKGVKRLNLLTAMKPPKCLVDLRYRPLRFKKVYPLDIKKIPPLIMDLLDGTIIPVPDKK